MFRYILAILLINTCYHSLGNPVPKSISSALSVLGVQCVNPFMNNLIKSKIKDCSTTVPQFSEKHFQCLIFYDMTNQLCTAVSTSQLTLNDDYTAKINEEIDVNSLCEKAAKWEFGNLNDFASYKSGLERVFKHPAICGKVCGAEELTSNDANFFCKFFYWGLGMLKPDSATSSKSTSTTLTAPDVAAALPDNNEVEGQHNDAMDISVKNTDKSKVSVPSSASVPETVSNTNIGSKLNTVTTSTKKEDSTSILTPIAENGETSKVIEKGEGNIPAAGIVDKIEITSNLIPNNEPSKPLEKNLEISSSAGKSNKIDGDLVQNNDVSKQGNEVGNDPSAVKADKLEGNKDINNEQPVLEDPKKIVQSNGLDYDLESDEGSDGQGSLLGGEDGGDPMINDSKLPEQSKADVHKEPILPTFNKVSQKGYDPTEQQYGYSDGDDDHFFTFFLTAVVMAILLYVLYHNKNKVSKVFFGLLLEGRQSGRRRNSRGHAYRRLDTLEQAMSTNTAAPPSKIIY